MSFASIEQTSDTSADQGKAPYNLEPLDTMEPGIENIATEPVHFVSLQKDGVSGDS
jgi:hypothetical protein